MSRLSFIAPLLATVSVSTPGIPQDRQGAAPLADVAVTAPVATPVATDNLSPHPALVIERSFDGLFYVDARVNGAAIRFVVDSGSSVVVLSAADARRAAVGGREGVDVDTASGAATMRRASIGQVAVAGKTLADVDAAIVDHDLAVSLLGQSALSRLGSVVFRGNRLELS